MQTDNGRMNFSAGIDTSQLRRDADEAKRILQSISGATQEESSKMKAAFDSVGKYIVAAFSVQQASEFVRSVIKVRGEIDSLQRSFATLAGTTAGGQLFDEIHSMAATTPLGLQQLAKGAQTMLGFGIAAEEVIPLLRAIGDISMGNADRFGSLTLAFSQMRATGKLMGQDLLQMINAGFNPLSIIAEQTGKSVGDLKNEMSEGAISAEMITKAFMDAAAEGGKFHGMLASISSGLEGTRAAMKSAWVDMLNSIGEQTEGLVISGMQAATELIRNYQAVGEAIAGVVAIYGTYKAAVMATQVVKSTATTISHTEEAASLYALLSAEQKEMIAKQGLIKTSAEYYAAVKAEATANVQAAQATLAKARTEVKAAAQTVAARKAEYLAAKELEKQRLAEVMHIGATASAKQMETAVSKLNAAQQQKEAAAIAWQNSTRDYAAKKTAVVTAAKQAESIATATNTAAETANASATGLLTVAKTRLLAVTNKLHAAILKNPYAFAAAAVAALAVGVYEFFKVEDQTTKATEDHAAAIDALNGKYDEEKSHINSLVDAINSETTARVNRLAALDELKSLYPDIFQKYIDEKGHITDLIGLQKELNEAQVNKRMKEDDETLLDYQRYLRDYKALQTAQAKGWDWATAGTSHNVNSLTADMSFFQSRDSFLKEKVQYWEKMVKKQEKIVAENNYSRWVDSLADRTDEELQALKELTQQEEYQGEEYARQRDAVLREIASRTPAKQNKKYWEDYIKQQKAVLEAMDKAELQSEEAARIRKDIAAAEKELEDMGWGKKSTKTTDTDSEASKAAERQKRIDAYEAGLPADLKDAQLARTEADVEAMEDGVEKQIAQINLAYDRLIEENERRRAEWLEELRDARELEWQNANPDYKEQGLVFDRSSVTEADLPQEQLSALQMYEDIANDYRRRENESLLKDLLDKYQSYEQQRTKIAEDYEAERKQLYETDEAGNYKTDASGNRILRDGVSQANVDELNRDEEQALAAIDEQFAQREVDYQTWCDSITNMTLEQLEAMLDKVKQELADAEAGGAGGQKLATARAKVDKAEQAVKKAESENDAAPGKRTIEQWNELREALDDCVSAFDDIGDAVGGVAGDIISTAGSVMASTLSMVNGIVTLVQGASAGMTTTATAAATAISTIEKASVILAVISAALQIATTIAQAFNTDDDRQEEIGNLQARIDQLQWELDNTDIMSLRENSINSLELVRSKLNEVTGELIRQKLEVGDIAGVWQTFIMGVADNTEIMTRTVNELAAAYSNVAYSANQILGEERYTKATDQLKKMAEQQILIQQQIQEKQGMKEPDTDAIDEYERQIEEIGAEAIQLINDMVEEIIGGSAADIAEELGEAFFDAFAAGEDAAEAWGEKVNEIVGDILKRMLIQKFLEEPLADIFDQYKSKWFKDGQFQGIDAVTESLSGFASDLGAVGEDFAEIWDALPEELKNLIGGTQAAREASEQGIATASQESVDELNGRATAIQGHTYSINENTKLLVANSSAILECVIGIEQNTQRIADRMDVVEISVRDIRNDLADITIKGVKIN